MFIYDYLFYKSYQLAKKLKNWDDAPVLFATMTVSMCAILNFASLLFLIEGISRGYLHFNGVISFLNQYKYISGAVLALFFWLYYSYKGRWKRAISKYSSKEIGMNPIVVIVIAYVLSFVFATLAAMYKNRDGIFG